MDDRKRSLAVDHDESTLPNKRQAVTANGIPARMEPEKEKDVEQYQKEAIMRQMREYKRERGLLEAQVIDLSKRATYHDDHIRLIDAWFFQLLDEIRVLSNEHIQTSSPSSEEDQFQSSLLAKEGSIFEEHLKSRSSKIRGAISELFGKYPPTAPDVKELQERMAALLAAEKAHVVELNRTQDEREQLKERLENASYRYLVAEKKLDRAKSAAVQKMEQQAIMKREDDSAGTAKDKSVKKEGSAEVNGTVDAEASAAIELARREAVASAERRKVQIDQLEAENKRLTEELSTAKIKSTSANDEDYAKSGLFSLAKTQLESMIKRLNDLEAANISLREEAQRLQAERTAFRNQLDEETRTTTNENEGQLARSETDLTRIRNLRDELAAEVSILKSSQGAQQQSLASVNELATSRQSRISALESEIERLRLQTGQGTVPESGTNLDELSMDDLKTKLRTLENQYALLSNELPSMEAAWKKTQALAAKKVSEIANWEDQISRLSAEKTKADQKYFAAMKAKEARDGELRVLKAQNAKTSEIVAQLKDADNASRVLAVNLEKQVAESKESLTSLGQQNRTLQQKVNEASISSENLKTEIAELKKLIGPKDATAAQAASAKRAAEVELEEYKVRLEESKKNLDSMKKKSAGRDVTEADDWRRIAICPVCNSNLRNTALKLCSHVFCDVCVQNLISHRSRKCPSCGKAFGTNDSMPIILA